MEPGEHVREPHNSERSRHGQHGAEQHADRGECVENVVSGHHSGLRDTKRATLTEPTKLSNARQSTSDNA